MAKKVTYEDILTINKLYYEDPVYSHVAKKTGFSAATVKRYIIPDFQPLKEREKMDSKLPPIEEINLPENLTDWLLLTPIEKVEIAAFKKDEVQI